MASVLLRIHPHVLNILDLKEYLKSAKINFNLQKSPFARFRDYLITKPQNLSCDSKSKEKLVAIAFKSNNYCYCNCWKSTNNSESNKCSCIYCINSHVLNILDLKVYLKSTDINLNLQKSPFARFRDYLITKP